MTKYYIVWNTHKSEGFITDEKPAVATAQKNKADRTKGYPSRSSLAVSFYELYASEGDKTHVTEIEIDG